MPHPGLGDVAPMGDGEGGADEPAEPNPFASFAFGGAAAPASASATLSSRNTEERSRPALSFKRPRRTEADSRARTSSSIGKEEHGYGAHGGAQCRLGQLTVMNQTRGNGMTGGVSLHDRRGGV